MLPPFRQMEKRCRTAREMGWEDGKGERCLCLGAVTTGCDIVGF